MYYESIIRLPTQAKDTYRLQTYIDNFHDIYLTVMILIMKYMILIMISYDMILTIDIYIMSMILTKL